MPTGLVSVPVLVNLFINYMVGELERALLKSAVGTELMKSTSR